MAEELAALDPEDAGICLWPKQGLIPGLSFSCPFIEKMFVQAFSDMYWTGWPTEDNMCTTFLISGGQVSSLLFCLI